MPQPLALAAIACALSASPSIAQTRAAPPIPTQIVPDARYADIAASRYDSAERALERLSPDAPEVALNLAAIYLRTGRPELARPLYDRVLARPAMAMDMPDGAIESSHDVALRAMGAVGTDVASR